MGEQQAHRSGTKGDGDLPPAGSTGLHPQPCSCQQLRKRPGGGSGRGTKQVQKWYKTGRTCRSSLKGREASPAETPKSEGWTITNHLKFNMRKCWIWHVGWGKPWISLQTGEQDSAKQCYGKIPRGPGWWKVSYESAVHILHPPKSASYRSTQIKRSFF